jgi:DNA-binding response OmpR family regulator
MSVSTLTRPPVHRPSSRIVTLTLRVQWDDDRSAVLPIPKDPGQLVNLIQLLVSRGVDVTIDSEPTPGHPVAPRTPSELTGRGVHQTRPRSLDQRPHRPTPGGEWRIDPQRRTVLRGVEPVTLTRREFDLLLFFAEHRRHVFTRQQLLDAVWQTTYANSRTVDVHIRRLRAKLGQNLPLIVTVHGVGYRLDDNADLVIVHDD